MISANRSLIHADKYKVPRNVNNEGKICKNIGRDGK